jgi:glycosyltransferase involved in cell wall biosynthesis/cephalosporin hydroxylase
MKKYKIIDAFPFNGELEMLKMRFDYLNNVVDHFVICESDSTQTGEKKELTYLENSYLFDEYKEKITYIVYRPTQEDIDNRINDRFYVEKVHRDFMRKTISNLSDENTMIMLSDVDEFPKKELFDKIWETVKDMNMDAVSCKMKTFYGSPLCELDIECFATTIVNDYTLRNVDRFSNLRQYTFNCKHFDNAGWHLSFFHTPKIIQKKIKTYSHSEYNTEDITNIENIKYRLYNQLDILNRPEIKVIKHDRISNEFPLEFYRHDIIFRNTFERVPLRKQMMLRRNSTMQIPMEIENLQLTVAKSNPKVILEIGTANGGTIARWFEIPSVQTIFSVDLAVGIHGGAGFEERTYVISDCIEQANQCKKIFFPINGDSRHPYLINRIRELLNGQKIDFLFIDGDHTYNGVKGDFEVYKEFIHENTLIGFHDIIDSQFHRDEGCFVANFWDELKLNYSFEEFIYTDLLDQKVLPRLYELSRHRGGFGGIGLIDYGKSLKKKISLIVPIYNNAELTVKNVDTILKSSELIDDVILYSNGSRESENNILSDYVNGKENIHLFLEKRQIGFVKAVNESIKRAKNELILCVNSDAVLYSNWEVLLKPIWENPNNGLLGPVLCDDFILGCCFMMKKSVMNKVGLLNEGFGLGYFDDGEISNRILRNGYDLGYYLKINSSNWPNIKINFPLSHIQGVSFKEVEINDKNKEYVTNKEKWESFKNSTKVTVYKDLSYEQLKEIINEEVVSIVINKSGKNFEKIRFDKEIVRITNIFECTPEMNIDILIESITKGKKYKIISPQTKQKLTWLAKFDDHSSMGILSQRVLENLKNQEINCKSIIGESTTKNEFIKNLLIKEPNFDLGIMFSYPDQHPQLKEHKTKVIYTGADTTGGIPNFANNCNQVDFLLTPSNKSKDYMEKLGVKKPIHVFPHGIDPNIFKYEERTKSDVFKFLYVGECSDRKGMFQLLEAFISKFGDNKNVELHIKSNNDMLFYGGDKITEIINSHSNIVWYKGNEGHNKVIELYSECHAYVYPSRADTFGMTLIEAMACGLPVISTKDPGGIELIEGRFFEVESTMVKVKDHPWMLGEWGEPSVESLKENLNRVYTQYDEILKTGILKDNSDYIIKNYSWEKVTQKFENEILPKLIKKNKVITLLTSFNRPHHIKNVINSLKDIREDGVSNDVYIVENSNPELKESTLNVIYENIDNSFKVYNSEFNMGQRGALLQMLEDINIDDYEYIQFTDQDNIFNEPLSTYCMILDENSDINIVTGYMSKEHGELGWRDSRHGNLCEKRSCRAGHMFMRVKDLKSLFPIHLDGQYGEPHNSSWNAGLDWEIQYWNKNAFGRRTNNNFVICLPGGVLHKGTDSTMYDWPVEENEYKLEELQQMRLGNLSSISV